MRNTTPIGDEALTRMPAAAIATLCPPYTVPFSSVAMRLVPDAKTNRSRCSLRSLARLNTNAPHPGR
jgi:hypothetical protein